mmetsp:Transcript_126798/g.367050  ORF Transcript_126798/g.367050 Transcript_126798/m.367050 type:complete len:249 (-) Transcript_126798:412-1158(-)
MTSTCDGAGISTGVLGDRPACCAPCKLAGGADGVASKCPGGSAVGATPSGDSPPSARTADIAVPRFALGLHFCCNLINSASSAWCACSPNTWWALKPLRCETSKPTELPILRCNGSGLRFEAWYSFASSTSALKMLIKASTVASIGASDAASNCHCSSVAALCLCSASCGKPNCPALAPPVRMTGNTIAPCETAIAAACATSGPPSTVNNTSAMLAKISLRCKSSEPACTSTPTPYALSCPRGSRLYK